MITEKEEYDLQGLALQRKESVRPSDRIDSFILKNLRA